MGVNGNIPAKGSVSKERCIQSTRPVGQGAIRLISLMGVAHVYRKVGLNDNDSYHDKNYLSSQFL